MNKPFFPGETKDAARADRAPWLLRGHNAWIIVGLLWLEYVAISLSWNWASLAALAFRDPDDAMRLVQVRDFLAGQSWFDVSQHRVNPPAGGPMHWSRLVDLPIAGLIVLLRPLLGQTVAEVIACAAVPLALLGGICATLYAAFRSFLGIRRALLVVALLVTCFPVLTQLAPLRIDHHGWQIAMAALALWGALHMDARRGGWMAGGAIALWLHISSEGLPYAALFGAVLGLRYLMRADEWLRLIRYMGVLAAGSAALLIITHGWRASLQSYCDAMSPVYLMPLAVAFAALLAGRAVIGDGSALRRALPLAIAAGSSALLFLSQAGPCLAGPFQTLDPVVYDFWYLGVLEGLPIWHQDASTVGVVLTTSLAGMAGLAWTAWREPDQERRLLWLSLLLLALGACAISLLVMRAMSVAHLFALPGLATIIAGLYPHIAGLRTMPARVLLTVSLCIISPAGLALAGLQIGTAMSAEREEKSPAPASPRCTDADQLAPLRVLPAATLLAPIDLGPAILQHTEHSVIGTAHHRNVTGLAKVIRAFLSAPEKSRGIVAESSADYLLICPGLNEMMRYAKAAPDGLGARLAAGEAPSWLVPVRVRGLSGMMLYRIVD